MANLVGGGTPSTSFGDYWDGDIDWYTPAEIGEQIFLAESRKKITLFGLEKSSAKMLPVGTILFTSRAGIGNTAILAKSGATNQGFQSIVPYEDGLDSYFIFSRTSELKRYAEAVGAGSTFVEVSGKQMAQMPMMIPTMAEQKKIGQFFIVIDNLITLHQRKLEHLHKQKTGLLQKMFPKDGADVPEIRFPEFTDAWEQRKLSKVVDVCSGMDYKHLSEGNIPVYGTGGYMLSVNKALSYSEDAIGIGRKGTIDKPYLLHAPFWTVDTLFYAVPKDANDLDFVHTIFQRIDWKQKDESTGVPSLSKRTINSVNVIIPGTEEQKVIGLFFAKTDHLITLHQRKLEHLQELKKALLQQMFV